MAEKTSTLILKVDLECHLCYKKIRKVLCKLQDRENIKTISYDEKSNTVTISGPFDPERLSRKLYCKGGKVIKDIQIKENKEKTKDAPKEKEKEKEKPKDPPKEPKPAEPAKPEKEKPNGKKSGNGEKQKPPATEPAAKEAAEPPPKKADPPKQAEPKITEVDAAKPPDVGYQPVWPGPVCCGGPWYEGYYGGGRGCSCGRMYGWAAGAPPPGWGGPYHGQFFCEEDSSGACSIM